MRVGYIYKIVNQITDHIYIGQTFQNPKKRWKQHIRDHRSDRHMSNALRKYGVENFTFEVLICCNTQENLNWCETFFIKEYNSLHPHGYNYNYGGDKKLGISEITRKRLSESHKGHHQNKGRVHNLEYRLNISKRRTGKLRPIIGIEIITGRATIYLFVNETINYGFNPSDVRGVLNRKRKSCKGFIFYYYDEYILTANQIGSEENKNSLHEQRLDSEPVKSTEYSLSTRPRYPKRFRNEISTKELYKKYKRLKNCKAVADYYNMKRSAVYRRLKRHNLLDKKLI